MIAACLYLAVAGVCLLAIVRAMSARQSRWHRLGWFALCALFIVLAGMRVLAIEHWLQDEMRALLRSEGAYQDRRRLQAPVFVTLTIGTAAIAGFWFYRVTNFVSGRRNLATVIAIAAGCLQIFLVLLRIVSLHSVDLWLYGPLKLNWFIDLGASVVVLCCALYYRRIVAARAR